MHFKTVAAIDLETSDLSRPRITEIAIVACEREHCENFYALPRVLQKLTICVNPAVKIHPAATNVSGLDNEDLMNCGMFSESTVNLLRTFIDRLPGPACLVAHNGLKFDFKILKNEIIKTKAEMLQNIYCADSLPAFREIFPKKKAKRSGKVIDELSNSSEDLMCLEAAEKIEQLLRIPAPAKELNFQEINETTPKKNIDHVYGAPKKSHRELPSRPTSFARRRLDFREGDEDQECSSLSNPVETQINANGSPDSYKLKDVFRFIYGHEFPDAHRAETDAVALMQCIAKTSDVFFNWIDNHAILFSEL